MRQNKRDGPTDRSREGKSDREYERKKVERESEKERGGAFLRTMQRKTERGQEPSRGNLELSYLRMQNPKKNPWRQPR